MLAANAREASGLEARLSLGSLIRLRLTTSAVAYFFIAVSPFSIPRNYPLIHSAANLHASESDISTPLRPKIW